MSTHPSPHPGPQTIRVGTRASKLALAQCAIVTASLQKCWPDVKIETVKIKTTGDIVKDRPLHEFGGKGVFVKELELALIDGRIDVAVHSMKDVPVTMPLVDQSNLVIAAVMNREEVGDVLLIGSPVEAGRGLAGLAIGATVGTSSLRRQVQLRELRPDLKLSPMRGNIDRRVEKLRAGEFDAIVLAKAGLLRLRLDLGGIDQTDLDANDFVPAAGQGALAIQCRSDDHETRRRLAAINDARAELETRVEREVVRGLNGDCHSPIGVLARVTGDRISVNAMASEFFGSPIKRASAAGYAKDWKQIVEQILTSL